MKYRKKNPFLSIHVLEIPLFLLLWTEVQCECNLVSGCHRPVQDEGNKCLS